MTTSSSKFETFWTILQNGNFDLPAELKPVLAAAINDAGYNTPAPSAQTTVVSAGVKSKKAMNGYNLFMQVKSAELKAQNVPSGERMSEIAKLWKATSESVKKEYKDKAKSLPPPAGTVATTTTTVVPAEKVPKPLTGYQFYVQEQMPTVKLDATIVPKGRMGEIGRLWKLLNKDQQTSYTTKAKDAFTNATTTVTA